MTNDSIQLLTNEQLLADVATVAGRERGATARLIVLLAELDVRKLYLSEGYSSLFTFCTRRLRLSEHAAYNRIEAARAARRFPRIVELLWPVRRAGISGISPCCSFRQRRANEHG